MRSRGEHDVVLCLWYRWLLISHLLFLSLFSLDDPTSRLSTVLLHLSFVDLPFHPPISHNLSTRTSPSRSSSTSTSIPFNSSICAKSSSMDLSLVCHCHSFFICYVVMLGHSALRGSYLIVGLVAEFPLIVPCC